MSDDKRNPFLYALNSRAWLILMLVLIWALGSVPRFVGMSVAKRDTWSDGCFIGIMGLFAVTAVAAYLHGRRT
jgi:hypothetical protein